MDSNPLTSEAIAPSSVPFVVSIKSRRLSAVRRRIKEVNWKERNKKKKNTEKLETTNKWKKK